MHVYLQLTRHCTCYTNCLLHTNVIYNIQHNTICERFSFGSGGGRFHCEGEAGGTSCGGGGEDMIRCGGGGYASLLCGTLSLKTFEDNLGTYVVSTVRL